MLVGATLAVPLAEMRLGALVDLASRVVWTLQGSPLAPGEADGTWLVEVEWFFALQCAVVTACLGSLAWGLIVWRGKPGFIAAALIGFLVAALLLPLIQIMNGGQSAAHDVIVWMLVFAPLGAATACLIHAIDRALTRRLPA